MALIGKDLDFAAALLTDGKTVAIPTETVYGLAANALNEQAVLTIFKVKERPFFDPLIIHVKDLESAKKYADFHDSRLLKLAEKFWPGPLTILLPKKNIPDLVTSGLPQVAVRVPQHTLTLSLLNKIEFPLAAPSANPFGYVSPTTAEHVDRQLGGKIEYILDGGPCTVGLESTIVGLEEGNICVYRLGGLAVEEIENTVGKVQMALNISSDPKAPGQLKNHYAPRKKLILGQIPELLQQHADKKIAVLSFGTVEFKNEAFISYNLSRNSDLNEAAINLFKFLRAADDSDAELVIADFLPDKGLGKAINDRLRRAAAN